LGALDVFEPLAGLGAVAVRELPAVVLILRAMGMGRNWSGKTLSETGI
jgi:hypothetical protein